MTIDLWISTHFHDVIGAKRGLVVSKRLTEADIWLIVNIPLIVYVWDMPSLWKNSPHIIFLDMLVYTLTERLGLTVNKDSLAL